jgi:RNA polymerase sigma-70 factor, ECF subfamily
MRRVGEAIDRLPPPQRLVITLRDIDGWAGADVCNALGISETNQRVVLHRARSRVRADLKSYFADD